MLMEFTDCRSHSSSTLLVSIHPTTHRMQARCLRLFVLTQGLSQTYSFGSLFLPVIIVFCGCLGADARFDSLLTHIWYILMASTSALPPGICSPHPQVPPPRPRILPAFAGLLTNLHSPISTHRRPVRLRCISVSDNLGYFLSRLSSPILCFIIMSASQNQGQTINYPNEPMEESVDCLEVQEVLMEDLTTHLFKLSQKIRHLQAIILSRDEMILSLQAELQTARGMAFADTAMADDSSPEIVTSWVLPDPFDPSGDASAPPQTKFFIRVAAVAQAEMDNRETVELRILATSYPPLVPVKVTTNRQAAFDPSISPTRQRGPSNLAPLRPPSPSTPPPARRQLHVQNTHIAIQSCGASPER